MGEKDSTNTQQKAVFDAFAAWRRGDFELAPVTELLGISPLKIGPGSASISMPADRRLHNVFGTVHGGLLCAMADVAMGVALATKLDGEAFTTLQQSMEHLRAPAEGAILARAEVVRRGGRSAHLRCSLDQGERAIAIATSTCLVYPIPGNPDPGSA
jgi:uncharacterized protein (TIGR00369 family)